MKPLLVAFLLPFALLAQDEKIVKSPNGQVEFRIFVAQLDDGGLPQLAYQIWRDGREALKTSWLGLDIYNQEPLLGQNLGLVQSAQSAGAEYNSLTAEYMQNGSLGRRLNVEARVFNTGVAFRYVIPKSTPLEEILIHDEGTVFAFAGKVDPADSSAGKIELPFVVRVDGSGPIAITEAARGRYPATFLVPAEGPSVIARWPRVKDPNIAFEAPAPLTLPWHVVIFDMESEHLKHSAVLESLEAK